MTDFLKKAFDVEDFKKQGHELVELLGDYLQNATSNQEKKVLPQNNPDEFLKSWKDKFKIGTPGDLKTLFKEFIKNSTHLHSPQNMGHQVSTPLPASMLSEFAAACLNNGMAVFEMGPAATVMEREVIDWISNEMGYDENSSGFITSGGSVGNLTALLAARQGNLNHDVWNEGNGDQKLGIMVSEQSHYSVTRAAKIMGLGEQGIVKLPIKSNYKIDVDLLEQCYSDATLNGIKIFAIVGNACSTATGVFDDLVAILEFVKRHKIWFHVDAAHGGAAILSKKYQHLLKGIEKQEKKSLNNAK